MLLCIDEVARRSDTDPSTILRWLRQGLIPPPVFLGEFMRWSEPGLAEWLRAGCPKCERPRTIVPFLRAQLAEVEHTDQKREASREAAEQTERWLREAD